MDGRNVDTDPETTYKVRSCSYIPTHKLIRNILVHIIQYLIYFNIRKHEAIIKYICKQEGCSSKQSLVTLFEGN